MFRSTKEGRGSRRYRVVAVVGLAVALASGAGLVTAAGASSKVTLTVWNDPLAAGSVGVPASKSFLTKGVDLFDEGEPQHPGQHHPRAHGLLDGLRHAAAVLESRRARRPTSASSTSAARSSRTRSSSTRSTRCSASPTSTRSRGWQFVTAGYKTGGTIYAVPYGAGYYYTVYYNKKDFAKAGHLPAPRRRPGRLCSRTRRSSKAKGITPFEFGEKEGYFGAWPMDAMMSMLGGNQGVLNMYNGKASLDTNLLIKPYEAWHALFADGLTNSNAATLTYTTGVANFAAGQAAMTITGQYYDTQISQGLGTNVGLFPVPALTGSKYPQVALGRPEQLLRASSRTRSTSPTT